ncbi:coiled-coil domain-containing protein 130 homolog isoform X2 [Argopecten irradians]|uniref:coiled-coil domain-containing protein 130 homolog isoform X2 n=1 Tax=Argopecten irradians TaxID=31199 RepID=UPI00371B0883
MCRGNPSGLCSSFRFVSYFVLTISTSRRVTYLYNDTDTPDMAERKSVNKYYPPDWDPSKGSVNKHFGQHPLRDRARKLKQGILVIRFELPYNIWCGGCNKPVAMGVRYNAEKSKVGNYYTTPIYKFRMKCHLCDNHFEIQTDPKNHDYVILNGARRKEQRWDPKDNEQIVPEDKATQKKLATDAMYKLEHGSDDKDAGKSRVMNLGQIEGQRDQWKDDYLINKLAREKFRTEKKQIKEAKAVDDRLLEKSSLDIPLVKEDEDDVRLAGLLKYTATESFDEKQLQKRKEIEQKPIFQSKAVTKESKPTNFKDRKIEIIKQKFAGRIGVNKTNVFDSSPVMSKSEKQILKHTLGVRRKLSKNKQDGMVSEEKAAMQNDETQQDVKLMDVNSENHNGGEQSGQNIHSNDQINDDSRMSVDEPSEGSSPDNVGESSSDLNIASSSSSRLASSTLLVSDNTPSLGGGSAGTSGLVPGNTLGLGLVCSYSDSDNTNDSDT